MARGTVSGRFGAFALAQILWSMFCSVLVFRFFYGQANGGIVAAGAMLGYLPLGAAAAWWMKWDRPNVRTGLCSVLLPAVVAWAWAGTTAALLYGTAEPAAVSAAAVLGLPAVVLASPSMMLVAHMMSATAWVLPNGPAQFGFWMAAAIFAAGLLPPLLFFLGSLLGGGGQNEKTSVSEN